MVRIAPQRVLLIGDPQREVYSALLQGMPGVQVTSVPSVFDGIAELTAGGQYGTVLAAVEPIERRPEAAVRTLRGLCGNGRLILFGHPTLELLSRKMLQFGCDDYVITPPNGAELQQIFGTPSLRLATDDAPSEVRNAPAGAEGAGGVSADDATAHAPPAAEPAAPGALASLEELPLADVVVDALLQHPHDAPAAAVHAINARLHPQLELRFTAAGKPAPAAPEGRAIESHVLRNGTAEPGALHLLLPAGEDAAAARHALAQLAHLFGKLVTLQDRHNRLQKLAITDDLTGVYNGRYFRHFLARITERARQMRFPVTLLLFDIDDFKKYNDQFGHGVGDEILKQTAALIRRCCRDHDLVARIGGDEFAVVFWDKEGPRQPRDPRPGQTYRPPQTPMQVFERFRRLINGQDFVGLGSTGRGVLGISAGLAVFPYEAQDVPSLIKKADELLFRAKASGKNSIYLVGGEGAERAAE